MVKQVSVAWAVCDGNVWCNLGLVDLTRVIGIGGVYVIWREGTSSSIPRAVYVGSGDIGGRLSTHRNDPTILTHAAELRLLVTWARVDPVDCLGAERFLADALQPLVGQQWPDVSLVRVNFPAALSP